MKIGIFGAGGRMGQRLMAEGAAQGATPVPLPRGADDIAVAACDVLIDFTKPDAIATIAAAAARTGRPLVTGTTGLGAEENAALTAAAKKTAVLHSANMSLGVHLLSALAEQAAARLGAGDFDIEILETHHRHKTDAPSGTARMLGQSAARGRGVVLDKACANLDRNGPRRAGDIGFAVLRAGDVVGEHTVLFAGAGERLELIHRATDRGIFARGALRAAAWLIGKPPGFYDLKDVLEV